MAVAGSIKHEAGDEILKGAKKDIGAVSPWGFPPYVCTSVSMGETLVRA